MNHSLEWRLDACGARSQDIAKTIVEAASQRSPPLLKSRNHPIPFTGIRISLYEAVLKQLQVLCSSESRWTAICHQAEAVMNKERRRTRKKL